MPAEVWNRFRAWTVGAGSARRIAPRIASSHRRATLHSGCSAAGGQDGWLCHGRAMMSPVATTTAMAATARIPKLVDFDRLSSTTPPPDPHPLGPGPTVSPRRALAHSVAGGRKDRFDDSQVGRRVGRVEGQRRPVEDGSANTSVSTPYGSAAGNSMTSVAGATGGSPPAVTKTWVGRSGGMLNGMPIEIRPAVP